jgi:hypothetical protein
MAAKTYDATTIATALFVFFCTFGLYDELWSDPGSDLMSRVVAQLNQWLGVKHVFSLVDRHQSNGVEGTNKQILRHLKTLVHDERVVKKWSDPTVLSLVLFAINDAVNSETGVRPLDAKFGSADGPYLALPEGALPSEVSHDWIRALDADLKRVREVSTKYQQELAKERVSETPEEFQNVFKPGEMVLWQQNTDHPLPSKLSPHFLGPYEVIGQVKNDVTCRHMSSGVVKLLDVERLKMFHGTRDQAREVAKLDADQYTVRRILAWKGVPTERSYMQFKVEYEDGDVLWQEWSADLDGCDAYGQFINAQAPLFLLRFPAKNAMKEKTRLNHTDITAVRPGDRVYVDLRRWGEAWYDQLNLPDAYNTIHVVECHYKSWQGRGRRKINVAVPLFDETVCFDAYEVYCYGSERQLTEAMTLVTEAMAAQYPDMLPEDPKVRNRLVRMYSTNA